MLRARRPGRRATRAFLEWARERAIDLGELDPGGDVERLASLDPLLEGKRIAFVGESNHWVHEKYAYRTLFLRYLHSRGWRVVGEELSWSDGIRVQRYLATGDASHLERVAAWGWEPKRPDRDDSPTGILKGMSDKQPTTALRAEQTRFAEALRAFNAPLAPSERLRFFGFDVDYTPAAGYEILDELLPPPGASDAWDGIRERLRRVEGESLEAEIARLRSAVELAEARASELRDVAGEERYARTVRSLRSAWQGHDYVRLAHPAPTWDDLRPAMALRERAMHEHVDFVLDALAPAEKLVLMSHDYHLARDDGGIRGPSSSVGPGGNRVPSIGAHLNAKHPGEIFSVWMLEDRGADCRPLPGSGPEIRSQPGTLNAILAGVGEAFVLPTRSTDARAGLLSTPLDVVSLYDQRSRMVIADQTDAVCFVREVSPLRDGPGATSGRSRAG